MAAYEAKFSWIGDLGGGVLSDPIGSLGLPETHVHIHQVELYQGISAFAFFLIAFKVRSIGVLKVYDGRDAHGGAPAWLGLY